MRSNRARFVSRLTNNTMALILAGGRGERLGILTDWRTKPAVPVSYTHLTLPTTVIV